MIHNYFTFLHHHFKYFLVAKLHRLVARNLAFIEIKTQHITLVNVVKI